METVLLYCVCKLLLRGWQFFFNIILPIHENGRYLYLSLLVFLSVSFFNVSNLLLYSLLFFILFIYFSKFILFIPSSKIVFFIYLCIYLFFRLLLLCISGSPGTHYVRQTRQASKRRTCLCLLSALSKGIYHYAWLVIFFFFFLKSIVTRIVFLLGMLFIYIQGGY